MAVDSWRSESSGGFALGSITMRKPALPRVLFHDRRQAGTLLLEGVSRHGPAPDDYAEPFNLGNHDVAVSIRDLEGIVGGLERLAFCVQPLLSVTYKSRSFDRVFGQGVSVPPLTTSTAGPLPAAARANCESERS